MKILINILNSSPARRPADSMQKDTQPSTSGSGVQGPARPAATSTDAHMVPQVTAMTHTDPSLTPVAAAAGGCEEVKDTRHDTDVDQRSSYKMIN